MIKRKLLGKFFENKDLTVRVVNVNGQLVTLKYLEIRHSETPSSAQKLLDTGAVFTIPSRLLKENFWPKIDYKKPKDKKLKNPRIHRRDDGTD